MAVDRLSSHPMNRLKYRIRSAFCRGQGERGGDKVRSCGKSGSSLGGGRVRIVTSHSIVGKSLTELIDHDEEDAQGVTKAALVETNSVELKHAPHWPMFTSDC